MFWRIYDTIKQMLCLHEWKVVNTKAIEKDGHYIRVRTKCQCQKCGKVKYL